MNIALLHGCINLVSHLEYSLCIQGWNWLETITARKKLDYEHKIASDMINNKKRLFAYISRSPALALTLRYSLRRPIHIYYINSVCNSFVREFRVNSSLQGNSAHKYHPALCIWYSLDFNPSKSHSSSTFLKNDSSNHLAASSHSVFFLSRLVIS